MAVLAQVCELDGTIEGKLYFRGQVLTINPGAEVRGGIDAQAQLLQNNGRVRGGITGKYQLIEPPDPSAAAE
jgi:cytoskeletal protein CcmA (bactofilin family)